MNVHHLVGVMGDKIRAQDAHETGQNNQLWPVGFNPLYQGLFKGSARMGVLKKLSMVHHRSWQALFLSPFKALCQGVVGKHKADLGLAFDGDADRCFIVDEKANAINPSDLTSLIAERQLLKHPGSTIIYNLISSRAVLEVIEENGGVGLRSRVGHSYIKKMMADSKAIFGGEHSGHFYFDDFWRADSGALAALHAIAALGESKKSMSAILKPFQRYVLSGEINSKVSDAPTSMAMVEQVYFEQIGVTVDHLDGLTVNGDTWWFNLRPSNTEPLLRLNVEAKTTARMEKLRDEVLALIRP